MNLSIKIKSTILVFLIIVAIGLFAFPGLGQDSSEQKNTSNVGSSKENTKKITITAREILEKIDSVVSYKLPYMRSKLSLVKPTGEISVVDVEFYHQSKHTLMITSNPVRGELEKILYRFNGEDIWVYESQSKTLFHKMGADRFRPILNTDFYYFDLSGLRYKANYNAKLLGKEKLEGRECYRLELTPLYRSPVYGKLIVWVSVDSYVPLRTDFHDTDNVIFKSSKVQKIREDVSTGELVLEKIDMLNIRRGTYSTLEHIVFDRDKTINESVFVHDNLGKVSDQ